VPHIPFVADPAERVVDNPCGASGSDACFLVSYERRASLKEHPDDIWFLDTLGRQFSYSASEKQDDVFEHAHWMGSISSKEFAEIVRRSRPTGSTVSRSDINHALVLLAKNHQGQLQQRGDPCKDGDTTIVRGYSFERERSSGDFSTLLRIRCDVVTAENTTAAAREVVQWVYGLTGKSYPFESRQFVRASAN